MATSTEGAIVVGVTGPGCEPTALRFAAECARREGAEVVLAHAVRVAPSALPPHVSVITAGAAGVAERIIAEVGEEFGRLTAGSIGFRAVAVAVAGPPGRVLVDLSHGARMVVVQHRHLHGLGRLFVGSTAVFASAHAACPVLSVSPTWEPREAAGEVVGEVVVGVDEGGRPTPVLEAGFAWAAATGAPLRIVHAWRLDAAYDDIITARVAQEWREEQKRGLASAVAGLRDRFPAVTVVLEVRHQWPTDALVDDSRVASLVVVGRHVSRGWGPERLGSLARTVLRQAKSPVMVVPVHRTEDVSGPWDLVADEISPQT